MKYVKALFTSMKYVKLVVAWIVSTALISMGLQWVAGLYITSTVIDAIILWVVAIGLGFWVIFEHAHGRHGDNKILEAHGLDICDESISIF